MIKKSLKIGKNEIKGLKKPDQILKAGVLNARIFRGADSPKFSFSVSKKVAKRAVDRNKAKRMGFLALKPIIGSINQASIQFYFTSLPQKQSEVDIDIANIIKNIK